MSATPATAFAEMMTKLTGNTGGVVQDLPPVLRVGGKRRILAERLTLAAQVSGTVIGVARIPLPFVLTGITLLTDTSLGSTTIALGNAGNGNSAIYAAAATLTATNTPTGVGKVATTGIQINSGFDCVSGLATGAAAPGNGGAGYEDIILTTGAATAPGSGTLLLLFQYVID